MSLRIALAALLLLVSMSACMDPGPPDEGEESTVRSYGPLGERTTRNATTQYYVDSDGPVDVIIKVDGEEVVNETSDGNRTWTLDLGYGQNVVESEIGHTRGIRLGQNTVTRLAETEISIDYCGHDPDRVGAAGAMKLWIDVDSRPSQEMYEERSADHADAYTVHDQLYQWTNLTESEVEYQWFESFGGYAIQFINGVGNDTGAPPYWIYAVNGESASEGMSTKAVMPGDEISWTAGDDFQAGCD